MVKGLSVYIYKNPAFVGCSNNGVSSKFDTAIIVGEGIPEIFTAAEGECVLHLVKGNLPGTAKVIPYNTSGSMAGGAFVHTSDSRFSSAVSKICGFSFYGAVSLHDRFE